MLNIIVIEDDKNRHEEMVLLLGRLYPTPIARIRPPHDKPCRTWRIANKLVDKTPLSEELVFLVDLALDGGDPNDAEHGIKNAKRIKLLRPHAILIAATSHVLQLQSDEDAQRIFDAVLDKAQPRWKRYEDLSKLLYETIEEIRKKRANRDGIQVESIAQYRDSLGLRLLEAVIGIPALKELVSESTKGWSKVEVEALSAGFSGSHLLRLTGCKGGHPVGVVLKVATQKSILQAEADAPKKYGEYLHIFAGCISELLGEVTQLGQRQVYYIIQASVPGKTLFQVFDQTPKTKAVAALKTLLKLLVKQYDYAARNAEARSATAEDCFSFRPDHPHRIYNSCDDLEAMGTILFNRKEWPTTIKSPRHIFQAIRSITSNWPKHLSKIQVPFWAFQHGDLHPGNVIVFDDNQLRFIDLARLGSWPVGYDISRFATQSRILLTDHANHQDWVTNGLKRWVSDEFAAFNSFHTSQICPWAILCDTTFREFIESRPVTERKPLKQIYELGSLSDLLRILSYQNISSYKRIWTGIACWQLAKRLGFIQN